MPKVHFVKAARKAYPAYGIEIGDSYWWWKFRYRSRCMSKVRPARSQLTQSDFLSQLWDIEDGIPNEPTTDDIDTLVADLEALSDECQDRLDNMPEHLQDTSESGMLLQQRIDDIAEWVDALNTLIDNPDDLDAEGLYEAIFDCNPGIG